MSSSVRRGKVNFCWLLAGFCVHGHLASTAQADPCGMVPPVYLGEEFPLARVGEQKTYVFYQAVGGIVLGLMIAGRRGPSKE